MTQRDSVGVAELVTCPNLNKMRCGHADGLPRQRLDVSAVPRKLGGGVLASVLNLYTLTGALPRMRRVSMLCVRYSSGFIIRSARMDFMSQ